MIKLCDLVDHASRQRSRCIGAMISAVLISFGVAAGTAIASPAIEREQATAGATSVAFVATLNPKGEATGCALQYVTEAQYLSSQYAGVVPVPCAPAQVSSASAGELVSVDVVGLKANTRYHFRYVLTTNAGTTYTSDETFGTFGIESLGLSFEGESSEPFTQAGGHPYEMTTSLSLNTTPYLAYTSPDGNLKDAKILLPQGLVGNPAATEQCTRYASERFTCNPAAQVGIIRITVGEVVNSGGPQEVFVKPLYNLVPPPGVPAEFGARFNNLGNAFIAARVRTGENYAVSAESLNITTLASVTAVSVTMWGVPGDPKHDTERFCREPRVGASYHEPPCPEGVTGQPETPFLTTPTSCRGPLATTALVNSYQEEKYQEAAATTSGMTGCSKLDFQPRLEVTPESSSADTPTGVEVALHVPPEEGGLAEANLKNATVTLPAGVTVNPSAASGLTGCPLLKGGKVSAGETGVDLESPEPAQCPNSSNIGSVELETPLFPDRVFRGNIYLAQQGNAGPSFGSNPFGSLLAIYLSIDEPVTGVVINLAGHVASDETTGQLTTTFDDNPQLPFEDLRLKFSGGSRAALATPLRCGSYETTSLLEPWSHEVVGGEAGTPDATPIAPFAITSDAGGGACTNPAFAPTLTAGTNVANAGAFGPFTTVLQRRDGEQRFGSVALTLPQGVAAILSGVPLCDEAQANAGTCSSGSQIGHVSVEAGVGSTPLTLPEAGKREDPVYLTGPYEGAPFGLSIVVHPEAGPLNLAKHAGTTQEEPVVVRAKIEINPANAQVSIVSGALPSILEGVPVDVKRIEVTVDRANFTFNPTNCEPMSATGSVGSVEGASAAVSSRFQVAGCNSLPFKPGFQVSTDAGHTKRFGAYLHVGVTSGSGQANIKSVFVELPKILPSRTETLKDACTQAQFASNPAGCPEGSVVGTAVAHTPVLSVPLAGPVIFVSHGGAEFPDLDVVLQGDGVTVDLTGTTNIVNDVTSSDFKAVPDVPVSSFEMTLPAGPHSALAATANLCEITVAKRVKTEVHGKVVYRRRRVKQKRTLSMPTTITGQNGAVIKRSTTIAVEGCPKVGQAGGKASRHKMR